jgi:GT2 family glycosyltransferase
VEVQTQDEDITTADSRPVVYVVIVVYNGRRRDWLRKCLDSIRATSIGVRTIAIDNGSSDDSVRFIRENYPQVDLIETGENLGFGKANNLGIEMAMRSGADYCFLLNQDAWVDPETIGSLVRKANRNADYGIISPLHLNGDGTALDKNFANYVAPHECPELISDALLSRVGDKLYPVRFVNAAAWLVTRECFRRVGGFSPLFFHYGEDDDYCQRVSHKGLKIAVYPQCFVYHDRQDRIDIPIEEERRRRLVTGLVRAANPNGRPLPVNGARILMNGLKDLYISGSIVEFFRTVAFYRKRKKEINVALKKSRSNKEFLYLG